MNKKTYSDEVLIAYLDGEGDYAPIDEINAAIGQDATLAARIDAMRFDTDSIKDGLSGLLSINSPVPELPRKPTRSQGNGYWYTGIAASALLALGIGYGAGNLGNEPPQRGWKAYVASYQALYSTATLSSVNSSEENMGAELLRASVELGKVFDIKKLKASTDVTYKRAQILNFKGKPLIQLAFLSTAGEPLALCIVKTQKPDGGVSQPTVMEGMNAASWAKDGYEYLLIGGTDEALLSRLADQYSKSI